MTSPYGSRPFRGPRGTWLCWTPKPLEDDWAQRPDTCSRWTEAAGCVFRRRNFSRAGASGETTLEVYSFRMFQHYAGNTSAEFASQANANDRVSAGARGQIARMEQEAESKPGTLEPKGPAPKIVWDLASVPPASRLPRTM